MIRDRLPDREDLPDIDRQRALVVLLVGLLVLGAPAGYVIAQSLTHESTAGVTYQTNSGVTVTLEDDRTVEASPFNDDQTYADGPLRISGSGGAVGVGDGAYEGEEITVFNLDATDPLTVTRTDTGLEFAVSNGDVTQLQVRDYNVSNGQADLAYASDGGFTITLEVEDVDGDAVGAIDASNGDVLDDDDISADGTVTLELPAGTRNVELQRVPSELQVRNEAEPDSLVTDNVSLRARFFADDGETVIEREVTDGTVSLDGLPADAEFVVTVREENADFTYRRILIDSVFETQEIYILPTTEPSAEIRFELRDQTGRFDTDSTRLFVEKAITRGGSTEYRTIAGDEIGADGQFPTILIESERYRLRVQNDDGETRVLGAYTVQGAEVAPLTIGEVEFTGEVDGDPSMQASLREAPEDATHNHEARIAYIDPQGETDEITVSIEDPEGNEIRPTTTETLGGTSDVYVETYPLNTTFDPEADTATVTVDAERNMQIETFTRVVGDVPDIFAGAPIDPDILELMGFVSIIALVGLLVIVNPAVAALVGAGYAGLLALVGVVPIPMPAVVLGGLVAVLATVGQQGGLR